MTEEEEIDAMLEAFFPDLTEEEQKQKMADDRKATDFLWKNKIQPNCDIPNFND